MVIHLLGWGDDDDETGPACTEVNAFGDVLLDIYFDQVELSSYRGFRFDYPTGNPADEYMEFQLGVGSFVFGNTGVSLEIDDFGGDGYKKVSVEVYYYAPP